MNEKEFLKNAISQEHRTKVLDLSAEEILVKRTSGGVAVRNRGFVGASVLAAAALTVGGVYLLSGSSSADINTADDPVSQPQTTRLTTVTALATAPDPAHTTAPDKAKPSVTTASEARPGNIDGISDPCRPVGDDAPPSDPTGMIESYPISERYSYDVPDLGQIIMSVPLTQAIEEYGDDALYRVSLEIYDSDGRINGRLKDKDAIIAEVKRLRYLGCDVEATGYEIGESARGWFTLYATPEQLKKLEEDKEHGYFVYLYGEVAFLDALYGVEE